MMHIEICTKACYGNFQDPINSNKHRHCDMKKHCLLAFMFFKLCCLLLVVALHMEYHCCSTPKLFSTLVARMKRPAKARFQLCNEFQLIPSTGPTSCVSLEVFPEVVLPSEYFPTEVAGEDGFG